MVDEPPMDPTRELQKLRATRREAMALVQRLDHRIDQILQITAAEGTDRGSRVNHDRSYPGDTVLGGDCDAR